MMALELCALGRRYGLQYVFQDLHLQVSAGRIIMLQGSNGSGKTTLLRVLSTHLRPSRGSGKVFGFDLVKQAHEVRKNVAYLSVMGGSYANLTAFENLLLAAKLYQHEFTLAELEAKLDVVGLLAARDKLVRTFSSGMKKRLGLARLILSDADLWLMDEPYTVLDAEGKTLVDELLKMAQRDGRTVLLASHDVERAQGFVDTTLKIEQGQLQLIPPTVELVHG